MKGLLIKKVMKVIGAKKTKADDVFHEAAGTMNAGMYHSGVNETALTPKSNVGKDFLEKKQNDKEVAIYNKKNPIKNTSNGVGVGY